MSRSCDKNRSLLSKCLSGNREASEALVRRFSDLVYRSVQYTLLAKHIVFQRQDLEDLHNTVFLRLFEHKCKRLRQYEGRNGCSLTSWIRIIAARTVLDHLRKKGMDTMVGRKQCTSLEELPELQAGGHDIVSQIERAEQGSLLQEGMQRLSPRYRLLIKLHFEQGLPVAKVAEAMNLTIGNAYTLKHRAIQQLKSHVAAATKDTQ